MQNRGLHHLIPHPRPLSRLPDLPTHAVIFSTPPVTLKKSVFVGHAVGVKSLEEAALALEHVLALRKVSKATHNIVAYRITSPSLLEGHDDNAEATAGRKLLRLLQLVEAENVLLVVTRWYGGTPLGPDRFRLIGAQGREALKLGGWIK